MQSAQSVSLAQSEYSDPGPPSSQKPFDAELHVFMHAYTAGSTSTDGTRTRLALVADDARGRLSSTSERLPPATEVYTVPGAPTSADAPASLPRRAAGCLQCDLA